MLYIALTFLSWIVSGLMSVWFRNRELKNKVILMHRQFFSQIIFFLIFMYVFSLYFTSVTIDLWFVELSWAFIYVLFSTFGYYLIQVMYELITWNSIFAGQDEIEAYIHKLEEDNR